MKTGRTLTERSEPVGSKPAGANELGLYDMSGNVWEWHWDWQASSYPLGPVTNYRGVASGTERSERGGGWGDHALGCTVAYRNQRPPKSQGESIGFRVVRP